MSLKLTPDEKENDSMKSVWIMVTVLAFTLWACGGDSGPDPVVLDNGEACVADNPDEVCASDLCVEEFEDGVDVDEGMCTDVCEWNEDYSDTCAEGEVCLTYRPTGEFYCFEDCAADADCRTEDGWSCMCLDFLCLEGACIPDITDKAARVSDTSSRLYDSARYNAQR